MPIALMFSTQGETTRTKLVVLDQEFHRQPFALVR